MENNDVLRRFRYALNIPDSTMVKIFHLAECRMDQRELINLLKKEGEERYVTCTDALLELFLNGLIIYNRGKQDLPPGQEQKEKPTSPQLSNNIILKKLRIGLELKQEDMLDIFRLGGIKISKGELTALFRKQGHKNYKECKDQYLKKFFKGLGVRHRM